MNTTKIRTLLQSVYTEQEYPVLSLQIHTPENHKPLEGLRVLDATPVYRNTLLKYLALQAAGAELTVGISEVIPYDPQIVQLLREAGIPVVHASESPVEYDLILDCAAAFANWPVRIGVSELTRSGVEVYRQSRKLVFLADGGRIKRIETCLGTGESYFRAMRQLGYSDWKGKRLVVFGSGKVGAGIIYYGHNKGAEIHVVTDPGTVDRPVYERVVSVVPYTDPQAIATVLRGAYAVVTATGVKHALAAYCPIDVLVSSGALLANMGVEDEYGPNVPESAVLLRKRTLNFMLEEPTLLKYIEATMALHNEGAFYLLAHPHGEGLTLPPADLEERILTITREAGCIGSELNWI